MKSAKFWLPAVLILAGCGITNSDGTSHRRAEGADAEDVHRAFERVDQSPEILREDF